MYHETIVDGWLGSIDTPNWDPLESFLPLVLCSGFMWMNSIELENGSELHAYKHRLTRRYLHLDNEADAWESLDRGRYRRMRHSDAIEQVFTPGWLMHHAEDDEREALKQALAAGLERGDGDKAAGGHILPSSPACAFRRLP